MFYCVPMSYLHIFSPFHAVFPELQELTVESAKTLEISPTVNVATPKNRKRQKGSKRVVRSLHALHTCHTRTVSTVYTRSSCAAYLQILQSTGPTGDGACLAKGKQYSLLLSFWPKCEKAEISRRIRPKGVLIYCISIIIMIVNYLLFIIIIIIIITIIICMKMLLCMYMYVKCVLLG